MGWNLRSSSERARHRREKDKEKAIGGSTWCPFYGDGGKLLAHHGSLFDMEFSNLQMTSRIKIACSCKVKVELLVKTEIDAFQQSERAPGRLRGARRIGDSAAVQLAPLFGVVLIGTRNGFCGAPYCLKETAGAEPV